jgi:uncharacterized RDD family membrane protein YckC
VTESESVISCVGGGIARLNPALSPDAEFTTILIAVAFRPFQTPLTTGSFGVDMSFDPNPFSVPDSYSQSYENPPTGSRYPLASHGKRFLGALLDGLAGCLLAPGYIMIMVATPGMEQNDQSAMVLGIAGVGLLVVSALALLGVQIYLMVTRSQSIGKWMVNTQMVDINTGQPSSFVNCFILRGFVSGLIGAVPCAGPIYSLVDILFIFREDRRCIHDLLGSTQVVDIS